MTFADGTVSDEAAATEEDKIIYVTINNIEEQDKTDYAALQGDSAIVLKVPYGARNGKLIEKQIAELLNHNLTIKGAVVTDVDAKLYRRYYGSKRKQ